MEEVDEDVEPDHSCQDEGQDVGVEALKQDRSEHGSRRSHHEQRRQVTCAREKAAIGPDQPCVADDSGHRHDDHRRLHPQEGGDHRYRYLWQALPGGALDEGTHSHSYDNDSDAPERHRIRLEGSMPKSESITRTALRPGRPDTDPPGCVVAPVW